MKKILAKGVAFCASLFVAALLFGSGASGSRLASILADHSAPQYFKIIHVGDLTHLMDHKRAHSFIFDADPPHVREQEGMIPGAALLSSYDNYDIVQELPADKNAKLVFYCHNQH